MVVFSTPTTTGPATSAVKKAGKNSSNRLIEKLQLRKHKLSGPLKLRGRVQILGHRGALFQGVENTLEAFRSCCELDGCTGVELDVFRLKDDSLVVFHGSGGDETPGLLKEYCEGSADSILDLTLEEAQKLAFVQQSDHLVAPQEALAKAKIPTLRQVLELFQQYPDKRVTIELKGEGTVEPTIHLVKQLNMIHRVTLSSFQHNRVKLAKQLDPCLRTAALFKAQVPDNFIALAQDALADEIHLRYDTCSVERVQAAHRHGFQVMAWFRGPKAMQQDVLKTYVDAVSEVCVYKLVLQTGVDSICCNRPHCAVDLIQTSQ